MYPIFVQRLKEKIKARIWEFHEMTHIFFYRHDVAEVANVLAYSFGEEGVDRHIVLFKKDAAPSEDHLNALRRGEEWNEEIAQKLREDRERQVKEDEEDLKNRKRKQNFVPNSSYYKEKYEHIIGKEGGIEAARKTEANSSYGCGKYFFYRKKIVTFVSRTILFFFQLKCIFKSYSNLI